MIEVLKVLQSLEHFGAGKYTEIAKGKHELVTDFRGVKRKVKRLWLSRK